VKILITGTEGYIGARMGPILAAHGHDITGLDTGFYRNGCLYVDPLGMPVSPRTIYKDLRTVEASDFEGIDAVVHLAELANDALGENCPEITFKINHEGSVRLARTAKQAGVRRFVYASSCSVYGLASNGDYMDESSPTNPQSAYAQAKLNVERDLKPLADGDFCVTLLRNATVYGPSPRMRFDIVLNDLCALAWTKRKIAMVSDGSPWRPIVHIEDVIKAVWCALEAPADAVNGEIFNVGATSENYRIREIAAIVADTFPNCELTVGPPSGDRRSYRVSFDKIRSKLAGFACRWTARDGVRELHRIFERIDLGPAEYESRSFTRLKQLRYLRSTGQIDNDLFWSAR
jgi:nucleoside-diphosphate-sugar epimerase